MPRQRQECSVSNQSIKNGQQVVTLLAPCRVSSRPNMSRPSMPDPFMPVPSSALPRTRLDETIKSYTYLGKISSRKGRVSHGKVSEHHF